MIDGAPIVHAQSTFPVPALPTSQIIPQPGTTGSLLQPGAQPCINSGSNILGPTDHSAKQVQNQENQCTGTRKQPELVQKSNEAINKAMYTIKNMAERVHSTIESIDKRPKNVEVVVSDSLIVFTPIYEKKRRALVIFHNKE